jgi:hypothetical protein
MAKYRISITINIKIDISSNIVGDYSGIAFIIPNTPPA